MHCIVIDDVLHARQFALSHYVFLLSSIVFFALILVRYSVKLSVRVGTFPAQHRLDQLECMHENTKLVFQW